MGKKARPAPSALAEEELAARQPAKKQRKAKGQPTAQPEPAATPTQPIWRNKEKPLVLCARGITYRYRHLMTDLMQLLPHHKTDSKLDTKHDWNAINEVAELKARNLVLFFLCMASDRHQQPMMNDYICYS
jgi:ribosome biogenesis protein BRX1